MVMKKKKQQQSKLGRRPARPATRPIAAAPTKVSAPPLVQPSREHGGLYISFLKAMHARLPTFANQPLFWARVTSKDELFDLYLASLPEARRQYHNCSACRHFMRTYGALVIVSPESGRTTSVLWDETACPDPEIARAVRTVRQIVVGRNIDGLFLSEATIWGTPQTGEWSHLSAIPHRSQVFVRRLAEEGTAQVMAARDEAYRLLREGLGKYRGVLPSAMAVVRAGSGVHPSARAQVEWLRQVVQLSKEAARSPRQQTNLLRHASAIAPIGWSHLKTTVLGSLLDDLDNDTPIVEAQRRFARKMQGDVYMRPKAAPTAGNIKVAEELIAELGLAQSLRRRHALVDELPPQAFDWRPSVAAYGARAAAIGGVFSDLRPRDRQRESEGRGRGILDGGTLSWRAFEEDVLPRGVTRMSLKVPPLLVRAAFTSITTAVDPQAPPILRWDRAERRNPFSSYVYTGGSPASGWGLADSTYTEVLGVIGDPEHWFEDRRKSSRDCGILFLLKGAHDPQCPGLALFPETLRTDVREAYRTIEAYSNTHRMEEPDPLGPPRQYASGLRLADPVAVLVTFAADTPDVIYTIDRVR